MALDLEPDNSQAWSNLGVLYAAQGRFEEAINCFEQSLDLVPDNDEVWNNHGTALFSLEKHEEALKSFNHALNLNPDNAQAWAGKGSAHNFLGEYKKAIESLETFIKLASTDLSPQVEEAWALIFELKMKANVSETEEDEGKK